MEDVARLLVIPLELTGHGLGVLAGRWFATGLAVRVRPSDDDAPDHPHLLVGLTQEVVGGLDGERALERIARIVEERTGPGFHTVRNPRWGPVGLCVVGLRVVGTASWHSYYRPARLDVQDIRDELLAILAPHPGVDAFRRLFERVIGIEVLHVTVVVRRVVVLVGMVLVLVGGIIVRMAVVSPTSAGIPCRVNAAGFVVGTLGERQNGEARPSPSGIDGGSVSSCHLPSTCSAHSGDVATMRSCAGDDIVL